MKGSIFPDISATPSKAHRVRIKQVRSLIGEQSDIQASVRGLGLRRINQTVDIACTASNLGMVRRARHLLKIEKDYWDFRRLSELQRLNIRRGGHTLAKMPMGFAIPIYIADPTREAHDDVINNATGSLVGTQGRQFCVTNAHVLAHFRTRREEDPRVQFHIGRMVVEPDSILVSENDDLDLAVFNLDGYSPQDFALEGEIPSQFLEVRHWPTPLPDMGAFVMFGGYPKALRVTSPQKVVFQSMSSGSAFVHDSSGRNIICRLNEEIGHAKAAGLSVPAGIDVAGLSGGPVIQERSSPGGIVLLELVGFIYEYNEVYDALRIRPAQLLRSDGNLKGTNA